MVLSYFFFVSLQTDIPIGDDWGRPGFDSMKNRYVSMSGAVKRPVNPGHKILIGENNYALAA